MLRPWFGFWGSRRLRSEERRTAWLVRAMQRRRLHLRFLVNWRVPRLSLHGIQDPNLHAAAGTFGALCIAARLSWLLRTRGSQALRRSAGKSSFAGQNPCPEILSSDLKSKQMRAGAASSTADRTGGGLCSYRFGEQHRAASRCDWLSALAFGTWTKQQRPRHLAHQHLTLGSDIHDSAQDRAWMYCVNQHLIGPQSGFWQRKPSTALMCSHHGSASTTQRLLHNPRGLPRFDRAAPTLPELSLSTGHVPLSCTALLGLQPPRTPADLPDSQLPESGLTECPSWD